MRRSIIHISLLVAVLLGSPRPLQATVLTFDLFTDSGKTEPNRVGNIGNGFLIPLAYGDHVSNFDPPASLATSGGESGAPANVYVKYGSTGGLTSHVGVSYRSTINPNSTVSSDNTAATAGIGDNYWRTGYTGLDGVLFEHTSPTPGQNYGVIRFTPDAGYSITLTSFNLSQFGATTYTGQTIKVVQDINSPSEIVLWNHPSGDNNVTVSGLSTLSPGVTVSAGHTLSLVFGKQGNIGIDNVIFSETQLPEPATAGLLAVSGLLMVRRPTVR